jgi:hypothetical protein
VDGKILLKLVKKPIPGIDLFDHQWDLIHGITPFGLSVIAI